tara:strand:+ start:529 stop:747 length:219 start_codon:yes stop_codon:yes gene_type:complete
MEVLAMCVNGGPNGIFMRRNFGHAIGYKAAGTGQTMASVHINEMIEIAFNRIQPSMFRIQDGNRRSGDFLSI